MKKSLQVLFIFLFASVQGTKLQGQNLVPNPSFEEYLECPNDINLVFPSQWYTASADPNYFNSCDSTGYFSVPSNSFGYQEAADGNAYCGFYSLSFTAPSYKEYLGCDLNDSLTKGTKYYISFKVNFSGAAGIGMATNNIGLLFSTVSYQDYEPYDNIWGIPSTNYAHINYPYIITDSQNWTIISGIFITDSAYKYFLIGNFFDISHTDTLLYSNNFFDKHAYYFIDDVCVSTDSLTCDGFTKVKHLSIKEDLNFYPNPTSDKITLNMPENIPEMEVSIIDQLGRIVMHKTVSKNDKEISINDFPKGSYIIKIISSKYNIKKVLIIN